MRPGLLLLLVSCVAFACRTNADHPAPPAQAESASAAPKPPPDAGGKDVDVQRQDAGVLTLVPIVPPKDPRVSAAPEVPATTREARFTALKTEHETVMSAYYELFRNVKTKEEAAEVAKTAKTPDPAPFVARAQALLDEDPQDVTALKVIQWMFQNVHDQARLAQLCELVVEHHAQSEQVVGLLRNLPGLGDPGRKLMQRLSEQSPHAAVRGQALLQCAQTAQSDARLVRRMRERGGADASFRGSDDERLTKLDPDQTEAEAVHLYERVRDEYGDVKLRAGSPYETTLAEEAGANLFEIQKLAIGQTVPDIEGEDTSGVAFKLSDYRGKVVMLDFWGYW